MSEDKLNSCLNLMRRMPPASVENSLAGLIELVPDLTDELLTHVDQPLKVQKDTKTGKNYVLCDYNRDGDSYRSPWSNEYFPAMEDGFLPSKKLRDLEVQANSLFDTYRKLYFEGGYSSAYFFETDEKDPENFGACFLIHKDVEAVKSLKTGWWDSIHVFEVSHDSGKKFKYKLTTTVMIAMVLTDDKCGNVDLSGLRTQQETRVLERSVDTPHVANMGRMLEEMDTKLRNNIVSIYIDKTRAVVSGMRSATTQRDEMFKNIAASLNASMMQKKN